MNARCKIMIVDDDPLICQALTEFLEANGYQALPYVHNYEDAKKQLLHCEPDLALLDIGLPGKKDGIELATYMYLYTQIPVVFITGYSDAATLQRAKRSHPHSMVLKTKPILDKESLIETVGRQLFASIYIAAPGESSQIKIKPKGLLINVIEQRPEPVKSTRSKHIVNGKKAEIKTLVPFDDIHYITTNNENKRNTIFIKPDGKIGFVYRDTLAGVEKKLPDYFVKVKDSHIINIKKVTQCIDDKVLFIDKDRYDISENYQPVVHEKKRIYLSNLS